nr:uncharacterized protein LOC112008880 [Quercus suber]
MPRTSIKGQVLADLTAEFAEPTVEVATEEKSFDEKSVGAVPILGLPCRKVYVDGTANQRGSGVGLVLVSPEDHVIEKSLRLGFSATNNETEYKPLLQGMVMVQKMGERSIEMFSDSRLVVGQVKGQMEARDSRMQEYLSQVKHSQSEFDLFSFSHIPRSGNSHADSLATLTTSSAEGLPRIILVEHLERANEVAKGAIPVHQVEVGPNWMDPIVKFLKDDILPKDKSEAKKVRRKAPQFWLSEDHKLYRRSYSGPYLLCIHPEAAELLLEELHEGICGSHTGRRSPSHLAVTQGYWWPGMQQKALEYVKRCDQCQRFAPNIHQPGGVLNPLSSPWSFAQWGLDIIGPFPKAPGNKKYLYSTPAYPQGNGQAKAVNKVIVNGLKKRLDDAKGRWAEELPHVLWTYHTTARQSTGETPFAMTYGAEAVIPLETNFRTLRTSSFTPSSNNELLGRNLDLVDERRERAMIQLAYYQ